MFAALPAVAGGITFSGSSGLAFDDREALRLPVPGRLKNTPRTPSMLLEKTPVGVGIDVYDPAFYGNGSIPPSPYQFLARAAAAQHGVPTSIFLRLVTQESNWHPGAVSPKGAIGLAQLMPATARALGVNPRDPKENLEGGARYLRTQFRRFGSWRLALAAYNAGPEAVEKYRGVPPYRETQAYVVAILGN